MQKTYLIIGAVCGALAVAFGAFGAHGLKQIVNEDTVNIFDTGVRYQFYHTFALLAVGILYQFFPTKYISTAGLFFLIGILLFSGSLYLMTAFRAMDKIFPRPIGIITPVGGLFFIAGWVSLLIGIIKGGS